MHKEYQRFIVERQELARTYGELYFKLVEGFYAADPIGITGPACPLDEYETEVGTIIPRLPACRSVDDVEAVLWQELLHWFGPEPLPPVWAMERLAVRVWGLVEQYGTREAGFRSSPTSED